MPVTAPVQIHLEVDYRRLLTQSPTAVDAARWRWIAQGRDADHFTDAVAKFLNRGGRIDRFPSEPRRERKPPGAIQGNTTNSGNPPL
jgi:hypothetical protein